MNPSIKSLTRRVKTCEGERYGCSRQSLRYFHTFLYQLNLRTLKEKYKSEGYSNTLDIFHENFEIKGRSMTIWIMKTNNDASVAYVFVFFPGVNENFCFKIFISNMWRQFSFEVSLGVLLSINCFPHRRIAFFKSGRKKILQEEIKENKELTMA